MQNNLWLWLQFKHNIFFKRNEKSECKSTICWGLNVTNLAKGKHLDITLTVACFWRIQCLVVLAYELHTCQNQWSHESVFFSNPNMSNVKDVERLVTSTPPFRRRNCHLHKTIWVPGEADLAECERRNKETNSSLVPFRS